MKYKNTLLAVVVALTSFATIVPSIAQDDSSGPSFTTGADIYSNYIWRGTKFGTGPAFQPTVKFTSGGLTIGCWGSFDAAGYSEADMYLSYSLPVGLSLGLTDYYYPGLDYFDYSDTTGSHAFEINLGFAKGGLSLSANYILNEAGGAASVGGDKYFQVGYAFKQFNIFLGAGDGWHTSDGDFAVCNVGIGTSKEIKITDTFTVPVTGQIVLNPERKDLMLVVGFSL